MTLMSYMSVLLLLFARREHHKGREGKALGCSFAVLISGPVRHQALLEIRICKSQQNLPLSHGRDWKDSFLSALTQRKLSDAHSFHPLIYPLSSSFSSPCLYSPAILLLLWLWLLGTCKFSGELLLFIFTLRPWPLCRQEQLSSSSPCPHHLA